ncbi:hypothetical protein D3C73_1309740 [compost metagenome]
MLLQVVLQILIEACLGGEFDRMVTAFPLREVTIDHRQRALRRRQIGHDDAALCVFIIGRETTAYGKRLFFG